MATKLATPVITYHQVGGSGSLIYSQLNWTTVSNASSYTLERKLPTDTSWTVLKTGLTSTATIDTNISTGTTYEYRLMAVGDGTNYSNSNYSETVSVYIPPKLATPILSLDDVAYAVKLSWSNLFGAASYTVQKRVSGGSWSTLLTGYTNTVYRDTAVTKGTTYQYRVQAVGDNVNGLTSTYCNPVSITYSGAVFNMSGVLTIGLDGSDYNVAIEYESMKRSLQVFEGSISGKNVLGRQIRDILGTNYSYSMKFRRVPGYETSYDQFFAALTDGSDSHVIIVPYGQTWIQFTAMIDAAGDVYYGHDGSVYVWDEMEVTFVPISTSWLLAATPASVSAVDDPSLGLTVDGFTYAVGIEYPTKKRTFEVVEGPEELTAMTGTKIPDIIGKSYSYSMTVHSLEGYQEHYDALFKLLSDSSEYHCVTMRFAQTTLSFDAYVEDLSDTFKGNLNGTNIWDDMSVTFKPMEPV